MVVACSPGTTTPPPLSDTRAPSAGDSGQPASGRVAAPSDSGLDAAADAGVNSLDSGAGGSTGPADTASALDAHATGSLDGSVFANGDASGLAPADDAAPAPSAPPDAAARGGGGDSTVCSQALGWWVVGSTLDPAVVPANVAAQLDPLLSAQHPLTLADYGSDAGGMMLQVSGTLANGISQQYFPFQYPATAAPWVTSLAGPLPTFAATSSAAMPSTGWLHIIDSSMADVWVPLSGLSTFATAGDALCRSLTGGQVNAVIPEAGGSTTLTLGGRVTTIGQLFGSMTSEAPPGWTLRLLFPTATIVQVSFK